MQQRRRLGRLPPPTGHAARGPHPNRSGRDEDHADSGRGDHSSLAHTVLGLKNGQHDHKDHAITVTSDLDEHLIAALADAPVDTYGAGTRLVGGSGHPTAGMVDKLVAIADRPGPDAPLRSVAKKAGGKGSVGGRKVAYRTLDHHGSATREVVVAPHLPGTPETRRGRALQVAVIRDGHVVHHPTLAEIRAHHCGAKAELTPLDLDLAPGTPRLVADPTALGNLIGATA